MFNSSEMIMLCGTAIPESNLVIGSLLDTWLTQFSPQWGSWALRVSLQVTWTLCLLWLLERLFAQSQPVVRNWIWRAGYLKLALAILFPFAIELPLLPSAPIPSNSSAVPMQGTHEQTNNKQAKNPHAQWVQSHPESKAATLHSQTNHASLTQAPGQQSPLSRTVGVSTVASNLPTLATATEHQTNQQRKTSQWKPSQWIVGILAFTWCIMIATMIARWGQQYRKMLTRRKQGKVITDLRSLQLYNELAKQFEMNHPPRLLGIPGNGSPMLLLGLKPTILLPESFLQQFHPKELRMALAHELAHKIRWDLTWNLLASFVHLLLFFHPLVWIAARRYRTTQEAACDAIAIRRGKIASPEYAALLIRVVQTKESVNLAAPALAFAKASPFVTLSERLKAMKVPSPMHKSLLQRHRAVVLCAASLLAVASLAPWSIGKQSDEEGEKKMTKQSGSVKVEKPAPKKKKSGVTISGSASASSSGSASASGSSIGGASGGQSGGTVSSSSGRTGQGRSSGISSTGSRASARSSSSLSVTTDDEQPQEEASTNRSSIASSPRKKSSKSSSTGSTTSTTSSNAPQIMTSTEVTDEDKITRVVVFEKTREIHIKKSEQEGIEVRVRTYKPGPDEEVQAEAATATQLRENHPQEYSLYRKYIGEASKTSSAKAGRSATTRMMPRNIAGQMPNAAQLLQEQLDQLSEQEPGLERLLDKLKSQIDEASDETNTEDEPEMADDDSSEDETEVEDSEEEDSEEEDSEEDESEDDESEDDESEEDESEENETEDDDENEGSDPLMS